MNKIYVQIKNYAQAWNKIFPRFEQDLSGKLQIFYQAKIHIWVLLQA